MSCFDISRKVIIQQLLSCASNVRKPLRRTSYFPVYGTCILRILIGERQRANPCERLANYVFPYYMYECNVELADWPPCRNVPLLNTRKKRKTVLSSKNQTCTCLPTYLPVLRLFLKDLTWLFVHTTAKRTSSPAIMRCNRTTPYHWGESLQNAASLLGNTWTSRDKSLLTSSSNTRMTHLEEEEACEQWLAWYTASRSQHLVAETTEERGTHLCRCQAWVHACSASEPREERLARNTACKTQRRTIETEGARDTPLLRLFVLIYLFLKIKPSTH